MLQIIEEKNFGPFKIRMVKTECGTFIYTYALGIKQDCYSFDDSDALFEAYYMLCETVEKVLGAVNRPSLT